jgi:hypothetical protein
MSPVQHGTGRSPLAQCQREQLLPPADDYAANDAKGDQQRQPGNPWHVFPLPWGHFAFSLQPLSHITANHAMPPQTTATPESMSVIA